MIRASPVLLSVPLGDFKLTAERIKGITFPGRDIGK
jgi:hypothetical protein